MPLEPHKRSSSLKARQRPRHLGRQTRKKLRPQHPLWFHAMATKLCVNVRTITVKPQFYPLVAIPSLGIMIASRMRRLHQLARCGLSMSALASLPILLGIFATFLEQFQPSLLATASMGPTILQSLEYHHHDHLEAGSSTSCTAVAPSNAIFFLRFALPKQLSGPF